MSDLPYDDGNHEYLGVVLNNCKINHPKLNKHLQP